MIPAVDLGEPSIPPPSYHRTRATSLHLDALTQATRLELLVLCRRAVRLAHRQRPPPLPAGPGGAPRVYTEETPSHFSMPMKPHLPSCIMEAENTLRRKHSSRKHA